MAVYYMNVERIESYNFNVEADDYLQAEEYAREMAEEFGRPDTLDYWISGFEVESDEVV